MLPQVDVAQFIVDEALEPKHLGQVVGLSAMQLNEKATTNLVADQAIY